MTSAVDSTGLSDALGGGRGAAPPTKMITKIMTPSVERGERA